MAADSELKKKKGKKKEQCLRSFRTKQISQYSSGTNSDRIPNLRFVTKKKKNATVYLLSSIKFYFFFFTFELYTHSVGICVKKYTKQSNILKGLILRDVKS